MIESIVENDIQIGSISDPLESCLVNSFDSSEQLDQDISNACSWLDCSHIMQNTGQKPKFEEFGQLNDDKKNEPPKLEIKPLPEKIIESSFETIPINDYVPIESLFSVTCLCLLKLSIFLQQDKCHLSGIGKTEKKVLEGGKEILLR